MKVLLTATVQSHICQFHRPLVEVLHAHGCVVHVAARDNLAEKSGLKLDFVDKVYDLSFARSPKSKDNLYAYKKLKEIINMEHYDVIHCNTPMGSIVTRLAARKSKKLGTKVYYTAHGFHFYQGAPKKNWIIFYPIEKIFSRITDKIITITKEDYQLANSKFHCIIEYIHGVGVDGKRYHSVSKREQLEIRKKLGLKPEQKIILCVGELLPNKNQQMAIMALNEIKKIYPDIKLLFAGNGPEYSNMELLIKNNNLQQNVVLLGYITNLEDFQQIADISVACSKREGLPLNVVEAMLSGTPVVASDNRGHRELICDGESGFLVEVGDYKAMADKVINLLDDKKLYAQIQQKAKNHAQAYQVANVMLEITKVYEFEDE